MTDTDHIEQRARELLAAECDRTVEGMHYDAYGVVTLNVALSAIRRALSARASAGEGGESEPPKYHCQNGSGHVCLAASLRPGNVVCPHDECDIDTGVFEMPTAAPQPAQAGASGGGEAAKPLGYVLESDLAQLDANDSGTIWPFPAEATDQISGNRCGSVPVYLAPASPATGQEKCPICSETEPYTGTCGSNDPRALCKRASPQPEAASEWVMVPKEPTHEMLKEIQLGLGFDLSALHSRYAAMLAAAPQPQEAPAPVNSSEIYSSSIDAPAKAVAERLIGWMIDISENVEDGEFTEEGHRRSVQLAQNAIRQNEWFFGGRPAPTPPAHGDGEGDEFAQVAASKPCSACGSFGPCGDAQKCMNTAITTNFRGETFAEARQQLVNVLKAQKSWVTGYAESYVDEFADMASTRPTPEAQEARDGVDARRYRYLRDHCKREWYSDMPHNKGAPSLDIEFEARGHDLDAAIDAALALPAQGEGK